MNSNTMLYYNRVVPLSKGSLCHIVSDRRTPNMPQRDFASYYERPDEEMLALWRTGVEETRNIIANDWA